MKLLLCLLRNIQLNINKYNLSIRLQITFGNKSYLCIKQAIKNVFKVRKKRKRKQNRCFPSVLPLTYQAMGLLINIVYYAKRKLLALIGQSIRKDIIIHLNSAQIIRTALKDALFVQSHWRKHGNIIVVLNVKPANDMINSKHVSLMCAHNALLNKSKRRSLCL